MRKANASLADEHEALRQAHSRCGAILGSSMSGDGGHADTVRRALKEVSRLTAENLRLERQAQAATQASNVCAGRAPDITWDLGCTCARTRDVLTHDPLCSLPIHASQEASLALTDLQAAATAAAQEADTELETMAAERVCVVLPEARAARPWRVVPSLSQSVGSQLSLGGAVCLSVAPLWTGNLPAR